MADYKLYCLDRNGRIARRHDIVAEDDAAAVAIGRKIDPAVSCELWSGSRKVALLPAGGEPVLVNPPQPKSA
ncbi:hypothetical protein HJG53_11095 [Sphingomonas sp. ID1715]|uniref:hypothetical protein n=1 Tax=Sphingomonas sp. ID1715 TaxID=1656898 RepID=UPI00148909BE|nr:hypothetical protein [Sphingomonas sp. ID1715]NNM77452.1 hypothetical protein [Sphingomonas sp. ID1715]